MSIFSVVATRVLTPVGLFALALVVRLLPLPTTFESGESGRVVFFGMDAWYHMRRVQMALAGCGWPPSFDPYVNFPDGAQPIWPPLFDALLTWVVWPIHVLADWSTVERAAALVPPVLGALCVVLLYRLALRLFDPTVALVSGVGLALLSAHFWYSQIGFVDHHAAVALVSTSLLALGTRYVGTFAEPDHPRRRAAFLGALLGLSLLLWPGMLLQVGLVGGGFAVAWLALVDREGALRGARFLALTCVAALAVTGLAGLSASWPGRSDFSPAVVSRFQPWLFALLGLLSGIAGLAWSRTNLGATRPARAAQVFALGLGLLIASVIVFPDLVSGAFEAWRWLTKDEVFQDLVRESKPLFLAAQGFDVTNAELRLSRFVYLLPLALAALAWHARTSPQRPSLSLLVGWTAALAVVTLMQRRFFNSLSPAFALVIGWSLVALFRSLPGPIRARPRRRAVLLALSLACFWLFLPSLQAYRISAVNWTRAARGEPMVVPRAQVSRRVLLDAAQWLRDNTPPTDAPLDPRAAPQYGVLSHWGFGHLLKYVAQRPTVVGNFGDDVGEANLRRATAYLASREPDAVRILDDLRVRYVLVKTLGDVPAGQLEGEAMRKRLSVDDSPGWQHHRLLYESLLDPVQRAIGRSKFRIFERVKGARIVGHAPPGAVVVARLGYESNRGRRGSYENAVQAGASGRYEIRVPYATRGAPPGVASDPAYRVVSGGRGGRVLVDEHEVQSGGTVAGPDFSLH